jgi:aryl-alcohol dehydrogenase-like predicted oxidoreductase
MAARRAILVLSRAKDAPMDYVRLGQTGMKVSRLCLGCMSFGDPKWREWVLPEAEAMPFFRRAIEAGINFFDTADIYSLGESERITGRALREYARRDEVVIATKVHNPMGPGPNQRGLSRKHIREACDASLKRLGTDYIDLYIIHRLDPETRMEEIAAALDDLVRAGKVLYLGASSMYAWQLMKLIGIQRANGLAEFASVQNYYNLVYREEEREMIPLIRAEGLAMTPWSPLARGYLAGSGLSKPVTNATTVRGRTDQHVAALKIGTPQDERIRRTLEREAARLGLTPAVLATAWVLAKPFVTASILGASKMNHIEDALAALALALDPRVIARLEAAYRPRAIVGHQ